jgi:serine-type D-Ala-D-Ala carboxypeptidase (penicillin-binding protein 5/6)
MLDILLSVYLSSQEIDVSPVSEQVVLQSVLKEPLSAPPLISQQMSYNDFSSKSILSMDAKTGIPLFSFNENKQLSIASLTKLMTALIILENYSLDEMVSIDSRALSVEGVKLWLLSGDMMTIENLLKALLIPSANDAALALAFHHSGDVLSFTYEMNRRAAELGMMHTAYSNPHGLDQKRNYSTAKDLLTLVSRLWKYPIFQEIVSMKQSTVVSKYLSKKRVKNTNKLLGGEIRGVKTGTTEAAAQCLLLYIERDQKSFFTVVLGSQDRYNDSRSLINGVFNHIIW